MTTPTLVTEAELLEELRLAGHAFSRLVPVSARLDVRTFIADDEWIVRVPTSPAADARLQQETRTLAALEKRLPLAIRGPSFVVTTPRRLRLLGERRLRGVAAGAIEPRQAARQLGAFCAALHAVPVEVVLQNGLLTRRTLHDNLAQTFRQISTQLEGLRPLLPAGLARRADAFFDAAAVPRPNLLPAVVIHGNLLAENVLIEEGAITAVVHWSCLNIGDPATDLASVYLWLGEVGLDDLLGAHPQAGSELRERVQFVARIAGFMQLIHGAASSQSSNITGGIALLDRFLPDA